MEPPNKRPKRGNNVLSADRIFNANSPITTENADIQAFVSLCVHNWTGYTEEEKSSIISKLPQQYHVFHCDQEGKLQCPIDSQFLSDDSTVKDQVARFKRDVSDGLYTKTWQEKARKAMEERASGKFDQYLAEHLEETFPTDDEQDKSITADKSSDGEYGPSERRRKGALKSKAEKENDTSGSFRVKRLQVDQGQTDDMSMQDEEEMAQ